MAKRAPKAFMEAVRTHRNRLEKVLATQGASKMKRLYDDAQGALTRKVAKAIKAGRGGTFTVHQQRMALAQLREGQKLIAKRLTGSMEPLSHQAQEVALKGLVEDVATLSKKFTGSEVVLPVDEAARFQGVIDARAPSLLRANASSMARYGANVVGTVEDSLSASLLQGETPLQAMDTVAAAIDGEWWQGERIVRTELSYAYNLTHRDGIEDSSEEVPELMQRWEENCDDEGQPMDDRVAVDSLAMHGQVTDAGGEFTMPDSSPVPDAKGRTDVPEGLVGLTWDCPPNRPNDRAVLSPWMEDWGVPGWRYSGGRRLWIVR